MKNVYYTYHVVHKQRPADVYEFHTIKDIVNHTGLSTSSISECLKGGKVNGWTITRTPLNKEKTVKEKREFNYGVIVYFPDGTTKYFRTQKECAKALGVSEGTVQDHLKDGRPDKKGREYDYPA